MERYAENRILQDWFWPKSHPFKRHLYKFWEYYRYYCNMVVLKVTHSYTYITRARTWKNFFFRTTSSFWDLFLHKQFKYRRLLKTRLYNSTMFSWSTVHTYKICNTSSVGNDEYERLRKFSLSKNTHEML